MPSAHRFLGLLPAAFVIAIAGWEIVATQRAASSVPDDDAWSRAASLVRQKHQPGDLIVFAPGWIDPVGRMHLGDLIPIGMAARMDAGRYGRIWELAIRGARSPDTRGLQPVETTTVSGVVVRRFERTPAKVLADVRELVATAKAELSSARVALAEVGYEPHRCILLVPPAGKPARLTFPQLPLGTELVGYVGIADAFTRRDDRTPVRIDVEIAGKLVASATAGVDDGWVRFAAPTTPGVAEVTFVAHAETADRQFCFAAEARQ